MVRLADFARRCAGLLLAAALTVGAPGPARAETAAPAQADVILLLDRSGSMLKNDPQGLTDSGAQVFVDMLDPQDRVAIVAFDSDARVLLPL
ncbi:MAG TPA: VWA domain-containing protein, partial [Symbiobacteriaceae bacterium]|nr:VWA domain-containing protein [Symbiobacteriaceae bacterium]